MKISFPRLSLDMSSKLFYDSDDERDSFDVERRQIESFRRNFLSASLESSDDDDEGIIDGSKIPSSTKIKSRARRSFMDISTLSSSSSMQQDDGIDLEQNPFEIISKSIIIEPAAPKKKKKSLGVSKSRIVLDTTDIYEREDSNQGADERSDQENIDHEPSKKSKSEKKVNSTADYSHFHSSRRCPRLVFANRPKQWCWRRSVKCSSSVAVRSRVLLSSSQRIYASF